MRVKVKQLPNGENFFEIPEAMFEELGWEEGDTIEWSEYQGKITLNKISEPVKNAKQRLIDVGFTEEQVDAIFEIAQDCKELRNKNTKL